jgi:hypothetical protein
MALKEDSMTIGEFIDMLIRAKQTHENESMGLTKFLGKLAKDSGLSARQITRIRDSSDFPESNAIEKLIPVLMQQMRAMNLDGIANRLLLPWASIEDDQNRLIEESENTSITIIAGWNEPRGIHIDSIANSITAHLEKNTKYTFLYPDSSTYTSDKEISKQEEEEEAKEKVRGWEKQLTDKIQGIWYQT